MKMPKQSWQLSKSIRLLCLFTGDCDAYSTADTGARPEGFSLRKPAHRCYCKVSEVIHGRWNVIRNEPAEKLWVGLFVLRRCMFVQFQFLNPCHVSDLLISTIIGVISATAWVFMAENEATWDVFESLRYKSELWWLCSINQIICSQIVNLLWAAIV